MIMLALVDGKPEVLTLKRFLEEYVKFQKEVVTRRTKFDLAKAEARAHILEGLRIALDNIDAVIKTIRESYSNAKENLMENFGLFRYPGAGNSRHETCKTPGTRAARRLRMSIMS